jgi:DNA modification methylase
MPKLKHEIKMMPLADLKPAPYNPRKISPQALKGLTASIKRFGLVQPIVLNRRSGLVVGGHQRIEALKAAGEKDADVVVVDLSPKDERALNVTLNNPAIEGEFTDDLQDLLASLEKEMPQEFAELRMDDLKTDDWDPASVQEDTPPPLPRKAATKRGDIWAMGVHRLMCGNATVPADFKRTMGSLRADLVFTDPPYGVAVASRIGTRGVASVDARNLGTNKITNDELSIPALTKFLRASFRNTFSATREGSCWYVCAPHGPVGLAFSIALSEIDVWRHSIVWVKDSLVMGRMDYHYRHEPIYYGWTPGAAHHAVPTRDQDSVWEIPRPKRSLDHPTMKPIELVARAIHNSSSKDQIILDPFAGAGSTLMACQQLGRRFIGIEIDPKYCDVIVKRWERFTGKKATR